MSYEYTCDNLFSAVKGGHTEEVIRLIKSGYNVSEKDYMGLAPMHYAAQFSVGSIAYYSFLNPSESDFIEDNIRPLSFRHKIYDYTKNVGGTEMMSILLEFGANINAQDKSGNTPLHYAAEFQSKKNIYFLIQEGADLNIQNEMGRTPLHYAAEYGQYEHGAYNGVSSKDALSYKNDKAVKALTEYGANVNIVDKYGYTALHYAAEHASFKKVEALINRGADVNIKNINGHTAYDIAKSYDPEFSFSPLSAKVIMKNKALKEKCLQSLRDFGAKSATEIDEDQSSDYSINHISTEAVEYVLGSVNKVFDIDF